MSHRVRAKGPVSGLVLIGALWMKKDVSLCHLSQFSQPPCEVSKVGTTIPILQVTKVKNCALCSFCKLSGLCHFRDMILS